MPFCDSEEASPFGGTICLCTDFWRATSASIVARPWTLLSLIARLQHIARPKAGAMRSDCSLFVRHFSGCLHACCASQYGGGLRLTFSHKCLHSAEAQTRLASHRTQPHCLKKAGDFGFDIVMTELARGLGRRDSRGIPPLQCCPALLATSTQQQPQHRHAAAP